MVIHEEFMEPIIKIIYSYKPENYLEDNIARGLMNLGNVWFAKESLPRALRCYEEALQTAEMRGIARLIWRLQHNIGNIYRKQGEYENARKWYLSSIESIKEMISEMSIQSSLFESTE